MGKRFRAEEKKIKITVWGVGSVSGVGSLLALASLFRISRSQTSVGECLCRRDSVVALSGRGMGDGANPARAFQRDSGNEGEGRSRKIGQAIIPAFSHETGKEG